MHRSFVADTCTLVLVAAWTVGCGEPAIDETVGAAALSGPTLELEAKPATDDGLAAIFAEPWDASFEADLDGTLRANVEEEAAPSLPDGGHFAASAGTDDRLTTRFPATAAGALRVEVASTPDMEQGHEGEAWLQERLVGATTAARAEVVDGRVVYAGAKRGVDRIYQVSAQRVEEYLRIDDERAASDLSYEVETGPGIADLIVDGSGFGLVAVDSTGTPVLKAPQPMGVDAHDEPVVGRLLATRTGDRHFTIRVEFLTRSPSFPVLLDPSWVSTGAMAFARFAHTATRLANGNVLVVGGLNAFVTPVPNAELYDPSAGTWSTTGSLVGRHEHTATLLADDRVLVTGGGGPGLLNSPQVYDPDTGVWSPTGDMGAARQSHTATLLPDGQVLVAGGFGSGPVQLASAELYDPDAGTWAPTGSLGTARFDHTATLLDTGNVLAAAGSNNTNSTDVLTSAELYDPVLGTWSTTGSLAEGRTTHVGTLLQNGEVLVAGGISPVGDRASAERYDPELGTWSTTGSMAFQRRALSLTLIDNGLALMVCNFNGSTPNVELYDPATGAWTGTGSMFAPRLSHTSTLLANGQVLVTGGNANGISASAELYTFLLPLGSPCALPADCESDFCTDDVCCDEACGDGEAGDCEACSVAGGATVSGTCEVLADAAACDDGDGCTQTDACASGACTSGAAVVCAPQDECHDAGTCATETGVCSDPAKADGTPCSEGGACEGGVCIPETETSGTGGAGTGGAGTGGAGTGGAGTGGAPGSGGQGQTVATSGAGTGDGGDAASGGGDDAADGGASDAGSDGCDCRAAVGRDERSSALGLASLLMIALAATRRRGTAPLA